MEKRRLNKWGVVVIVAGVILIGFLIINSYLKEKNNLAREKFEQEKIENERKFDADQKVSCLGVYKQESSKWNNVEGWRYDETDNSCYVQYKMSPKKTQVQCDEEYKGADGKVISIFFTDWMLCGDGLFEKSF